MPTPNKLEKALKLNFNPANEQIGLTNQKTLRTLVGILGLALPVLLYVVLAIDPPHHYSPLYSISHYYFTRASSIFVIVVSLMAVFLLVYRGKERVDFYVSAAAGIFALLLVLFPTGNITGNCKDENFPYCITIMQDNRAREAFHYISAAIFLGCLAYMSIFLFTKTAGTRDQQTKRKKIRNKIYRVCGVVMLAAILVVFANFLDLISDEVFDKYHLTFWMEAIAIWAFGFSWLVKGEVILRD